MSKRTERNSSIELLRIIAMSAILVYHFFVHGSAVFETSSYVKSFVISFMYWGVNVFIMISGYCGMKLKLHSFLKLYATVSLFVLANLLMLYLCDVPLSLKSVRSVVLPFSSGGYWFMAIYLGLLFTTPILLNGISNLSTHSLRKVVFILFVFNVFCCGVNKNMSNVNGYTYMQFLFMYVIGYWLSKDNQRFSSLSCVMMALMIGVTEMCVAVACENFLGRPIAYFMKYNNIFVVCQSICIFAAFTKFDFRNKFINHISSATLGCYLLQDGLFGQKFLYDFLKQHSTMSTYLIVLGGVCAISYFITKLREQFDSMILMVSKRLESKVQSLTKDIRKKSC